MMSYIVFSPISFAQAYGTGTYGCGTYQQGCTGTAPSVPNTGMALMEPSFVIPSALVGAVAIALITTAITRAVRRRRRSATKL